MQKQYNLFNGHLWVEIKIVPQKGNTGVRAAWTESRFEFEPEEDSGSFPSVKPD